ncbi:MAG: hypothetical protein NTX15_07995 [Candidatus Kapabacteria bacterium]|nr:hypothetical protein [Candidatus Kapabacteria bacterium]
MRMVFSFIVLLLSTLQTYAQTDSVFTLETVVTGSIMTTQYSENPTTQSVTDRFTGSAFLGRILWRPNHLLAIGVQSGYMTFSQESFTIPGVGATTSGKAGLAAIPLQLAISMNPGSFDLGIGIGSYYLQSIWRVEDVQRVNSTAWEFGVNSWIGYEFTVFDRLEIGPELSLHVLSNRGIASLALGVRIRYDVIRY